MKTIFLDVDGPICLMKNMKNFIERLKPDIE